jgi:hypothetical protein
MPLSQGHSNKLFIVKFFKLKYINKISISLKKIVLLHKNLPRKSEELRRDNTQMATLIKAMEDKYQALDK